MSFICNKTATVVLEKKRKFKLIIIVLSLALTLTLPCQFNLKIPSRERDSAIFETYFYHLRFLHFTVLYHKIKYQTDSNLQLCITFFVVLLIFRYKNAVLYFDLWSTSKFRIFLFMQICNINNFRLNRMCNYDYYISHHKFDHFNNCICREEDH